MDIGTLRLGLLCTHGIYCSGIHGDRFGLAPYQYRDSQTCVDGGRRLDRQYYFDFIRDLEGLTRHYRALMLRTSVNLTRGLYMWLDFAGFERIPISTLDPCSLVISVGRSARHSGCDGDLPLVGWVAERGINAKLGKSSYARAPLGLTLRDSKRFQAA